MISSARVRKTSNSRISESSNFSTVKCNRPSIIVYHRCESESAGRTFREVSLGETVAARRRRCHISGWFLPLQQEVGRVFLRERTCDGLKADGNYGGSSAAGIPFPGHPTRDPTSPEIKVPTYWLKGVVKFTDTAVRRAGSADPSTCTIPHGPTLFLSFSILRHPSFDSRVNGAMITFARRKSIFLSPLCCRRTRRLRKLNT